MKAAEEIRTAQAQLAEALAELAASLRLDGFPARELRRSAWRRVIAARAALARADAELLGTMGG